MEKQRSLEGAREREREGERLDPESCCQVNHAARIFFGNDITKLLVEYFGVSLDYNLLVFNRGSLTNMNCGTSWFHPGKEQWNSCFN